MSEFETVARPYSKAVFELASEQGELQFWSDVLQLAAAIASEANIQALAAAPEILSEQLTELFISIMTDAENAPEMNKEVKNMVALLAENDRLMALPAIHEGYEALKQASEGTVQVQVTSARKLTVKQEKEMAANLKKRLGKEVAISAHIDQSLIAGAIIHAGDLVIDGSARGRLNKLTSLLNK
jgi:F-type H+-transporting ATPase subunit delta